MKVAIKKIKIIVLVLICLGNASVMCSEQQTTRTRTTGRVLGGRRTQEATAPSQTERRTTATQPAQTKQPVRNQSGTRAPQQKPVEKKPQQARQLGGRGATQIGGQGTQQQRGRQNAPQKAPQVEVDELVWDQLSPEEQDAFTGLNNTFTKILFTASKPTQQSKTLWQDRVTKAAQDIIALNPLLMDYCIESISKELDDTEEDRGIDSEQFMKTVENALRTYLPESILITGTTEEQLKDLMNYIPRSQDGMPTKEWVRALYERAENLVVSGEMTIEKLRTLLITGLGKTVSMQFIENVINEIENLVINQQLQNSPEYINDTFTGLLKQVATPAYWDTIKNQPNLTWIKAIENVGKKMAQVVHMPLDKIESDIGSQIYYFAAGYKINKTLSPSEEQSIVTLVNTIMSNIKR